MPKVKDNKHSGLRSLEDSALEMVTFKIQMPQEGQIPLQVVLAYQRPHAETIQSYGSAKKITLCPILAFTITIVLKSQMIPFPYFILHWSATLSVRRVVPKFNK